jgi:hypothetical protein
LIRIFSYLPSRRGSAALSLILLVAIAGAACTKPPGAPGWTLVWSDDFDGPAGSSLSNTEWLHATGTGYPGGAPAWGTGQVETATDRPENVRLDGDGHLMIVPLRTAEGAWTSARVESRRSDFAAPPDGKVRIEAVLRQPDVTGAEAAGYWAAFWALGAPARPVGSTNWPHVGEWDVMEAVNGRDSVWQTLHCGEPVGGPCGEPTGIGSGEQACAGCRGGFHTYAIEFDRSVTPEQLRWYVDDRNTFTVAADRVDAVTWEKANHHGFFVILNVAVGGAFPAGFGGGATALTKPGVPLLVDRVAVSTSGPATR